MEDSKPRNEKENTRVLKAAGVVGLATFLSRIFGFIRDMVVAGFFGAGFATDAFFVAFRIPNLLRRLFAEGSLTIAFVPVFTEYLKNRSKKDAFELANIAFTLLSSVLVVVVLAGVIFSPLIIKVIAPGFLKDPEQYGLAVFLTRLMFPYIFFISLVALCMGVLNSLRHFATPALAPVVLNLAMILTVLFLRGAFKAPITALAIGVVAGGILQLAMQFPYLVKMGFHLKPDFQFDHPAIRKIVLLMVPSVFGAAVYQINIFVSTFLASLLPSGSVSYLYYADRLVQLPLGVFAIAVGTASLPSLSELVARGEYDEMKKTISFSLQLILFVTIPAMVALIALRVPIISVLFQRGEFDVLSTMRTSEALLFYAAGLWAFSVIRVIVAAFYALQDTKTPVKVAVVALFVNAVMSVILMVPLKHGGLALAISISSVLNVIVLYFVLRKRVGQFLDRGFYTSFFKVVLASFLMWGSIVFLNHIFPWNNEAPFNERFIILAAAIGTGFTTFIGASFCLKSKEIMVLIETVKRKAGRRRAG